MIQYQRPVAQPGFLFGRGQSPDVHLTVSEFDTKNHQKSCQVCFGEGHVLFGLILAALLPTTWTIFCRYFGICVALFAIFVGGIGNLLTILAYNSNRKLQTTFNVFIVNLSCVDMISAVVKFPFLLAGYVQMRWWVAIGANCTCVAFACYSIWSYIKPRENKDFSSLIITATKKKEHEKSKWEKRWNVSRKIIFASFGIIRLIFLASFKSQPTCDRMLREF